LVPAEVHLFHQVLFSKTSIPLCNIIFFKNETFCFARARLSIGKTFCKTGIQRKVIKFKEGNAGIVLAHNSYHLMHQASELKESRRWQMHRGLPCFTGESGLDPQMSK
jgi:hypothetical protein